MMERRYNVGFGALGAFIWLLFALVGMGAQPNVKRRSVLLRRGRNAEGSVVVLGHCVTNWVENGPNIELFLGEGEGEEEGEGEGELAMSTPTKLERRRRRRRRRGNNLNRSIKLPWSDLSISFRTRGARDETQETDTERERERMGCTRNKTNHLCVARCNL